MPRIGEAMVAISDVITKVTANVTAVTATITSATTKSKAALDDIRFTVQALGFTGTTPQTFMSSAKSEKNDEASVSVPPPTNIIEDNSPDE